MTTVISAERVRAALEGSIEKWRRIVAGETKNGGAEDCPLCKLFNPFMSGESVTAGCGGCPVRQRTTQDFCNGSPYDRYAQLEDEWKRLVRRGETLRYAGDADALLQQAAIDELRFLESLR